VTDPAGGVREAWRSALDEFEARLALGETILELGVAVGPPGPFEPPDLPAPLPTELFDRASALLERAGSLEHRLVAEQARIREELARLPKPAGAPRPPLGSRFDAGA
jgi:hypothetical protein